MKNCVLSSTGNAVRQGFTSHFKAENCVIEGPTAIYASSGTQELIDTVLLGKTEKPWYNSDALAKGWSVYGNAPALLRDVIVPAGETFNVPAGAKLTIPDGVTFTNRGVLNIAEGGVVENEGLIHNEGGVFGGIGADGVTGGGMIKTTI